MAIQNDVAITGLAAPGSIENEFLRSADADHNGRVSPQEFTDQVTRGLPAGMTKPKLDALATGFLNTLAPGSAGGVSTGGSPGGVVLPNSVAISERFGTAIFGGSTFSTFDVKDDKGRPLAVIERRWRSSGFADALHNGLAPTLTLRNPAVKDKNVNVVAEGRPVVLDTRELSNNFRNVINIVDGQGRQIGVVRERWDSTLGSALQRAVLGGTVATWYEVLDASGQVVANSQKTEVLATNLEVTANGQRVANIHRGFFSSLVRDNWTVDVASTDVDRRVLVLMAAYKTWADKKAAEERAARSSDDR